MCIAILSSTKNHYSTRRLKEAIELLRHTNNRTKGKG